MERAVLRLQRWVDRWSRWGRVSASAPGEPRRRFLIVQIDGLSRELLDAALARGALRNVRRLLTSRQLRRRELNAGIPSCTPFFQAAIMYGGRPDIPGFQFYDKRARRPVHFPKRGAAHFVEERHAVGRGGILEGGSCYGSIFTGGAADDLWTFARLGKLTRAGSGVRRAALSGLLLGWVAVKCVALTAGTLGHFAGRAASGLTRGRFDLRRSLSALWIDVGLSIWARQLFTLLASADLYRGVPAVYVNFLDYDVTAHAFGPRDRLALRALRRVDRSIGQLARVVRRVPEFGYDLYVLSDHGQTGSRRFRDVAAGRSVEDVVRAELAGEDRAGLRVVAAGPNAFVYFTDRDEALSAAEIECRHPGALGRLSRHPGVGFALARGTSGPVCWWRGHRSVLARGEETRAANPFALRPDRHLVIDGLCDLLDMPSAGDIVLYGTGAPGGDVSFVDELGAHGGPSPEEMHAFILHPRAVELSSQILTHPRRLHAHFADYRGAGERGRAAFRVRSADSR